MSRSDRASEGRSGSAANVVGPCRSFVTAAAPCAPSMRPSFGHDLHAMTEETVRHEFVDLAEDERLRTDIETMQSNEQAFRYWAAGVGPAYLEGAFRRARSDAADGSAGLAPSRSPVPRPAVLDPFEVDAQGEGRLAAQLRGLDVDRIRDIARA